MNYSDTVREFGDVSRLAVNAAATVDCVGATSGGDTSTSGAFHALSARHQFRLATKLQDAFMEAGGESYGADLVLHWMALQSNTALLTELRNHPGLSVDGSLKNACFDKLLQTFKRSEDEKFRSQLLGASLPDGSRVITPVAQLFGVGFRRLQTIAQNRLLPGYDCLDPTPQQPRSHLLPRVVIINFINMVTSRRTPNRTKDFYAKHKENGTLLVRVKHFYKRCQPLHPSTPLTNTNM
jgi:hypothetical protein